MNDIKQDDKLFSYPIVLSVVFHIILLAIFAFVRFSSKPAIVHAAVSPRAKINAVRRLLEKPRVLPKPKVIGSNLSEKGIYPVIQEAAKSETPSLPAISDDQGKTLAAKAAIDDLSFNTVKTTGNIRFFGNPVSQKRLCFVVDCSGSMQGVFEKVKSQLKASVRSLEPDCYFQIIFFGDNQLYNFGGGSTVRASTPAKRKATEFINQIEPRGQTNAFGAITSAMSGAEAARKSPDVIYFLTDGFNLSGNDDNYLLTELLSFRNEHCPQTIINTIGFWPKSKDKVILMQLAQMTGGTYTSAGN
ncbi:MAG: VWA domain-containing protein [Phycisphaerae bacterium]|nr:VWA domain-containing protein [Phycisphaerae bacterium]